MGGRGSLRRTSAVAEQLTEARRRRIRSATIAVRASLRELEAEVIRELAGLYAQAAADARAEVATRSEGGEISPESVDGLVAALEHRLDRLREAEESALSGRLDEAAALAVEPWRGAIETSIESIADGAARFVQEFAAADGLQLSDRLWRVDRLAKRQVRDAIASSVLRGASAHQAAAEFIARGDAVPLELRQKMKMGDVSAVQSAVDKALMTGRMNPSYQAERLFRTELNRAHAEAYRRATQQHPDTIGVQFKLSPRHPRVDICDLHANRDAHGLGPGVYPHSSSPYPAHPNTLSFEVVVFRDEVTEGAPESMVQWLHRQPPSVQVGVLGQQKAKALRSGLLDDDDVTKNWRDIEQAIGGLL